MTDPPLTDAQRKEELADARDEADQRWLSGFGIGPPQPKRAVKAKAKKGPTKGRSQSH